MRVTWHPLWPEWGASSRLRVYTLHREMAKLGVESTLGFDLSADVLVIQKHPSAETLERARGAKGLVVYDFDDIETLPALPLAAQVARVVTTDTPEHREMALPLIGSTPCEVLSDPIDYYPTEPLPPSAPDTVVWFGHHLNYHCVALWVELLIRNNVKVRVISSEEMQARLPEGVEFVPWRLDTFVGELRKSLGALLSHIGADRGKSENKMTTALAYGLCCLVSDTPAYARLARQLGGTRSPFGFWNVPWTPEAQRLVWERYSPEACAKRFLAMVGRYR